MRARHILWLTVEFVPLYRIVYMTLWVTVTLTECTPGAIIREHLRFLVDPSLLDSWFGKIGSTNNCVNTVHAWVCNLAQTPIFVPVFLNICLYYFCIHQVLHMQVLIV